MPVEIALTEGTKLRVDRELDEVLELLGGGEPKPGWVYIAQESEQGQLHFNPAHVAYVREVPELQPFVYFGR